MPFSKSVQVCHEPSHPSKHARNGIAACLIASDYLPLSAPSPFPSFPLFNVFRWYHFFAHAQAVLNIARSVFIILVLASFLWFLSRDSRALVLDPIERMVASVSELAENPLAQQVSEFGVNDPSSTPSHCRIAIYWCQRCPHKCPRFM